MTNYIFFLNCLNLLVQVVVSELTHQHTPHARYPLTHTPSTQARYTTYYLGYETWLRDLTVVAHPCETTEII